MPVFSLNKTNCLKQKGSLIQAAIADYLASLINECICGRDSAEAENKKPLPSTWKDRLLNFKFLKSLSRLGNCISPEANSCSVPRIFQELSSYILLPFGSVLKPRFAVMAS